MRLATVAVAVPLLFLIACSGASGDPGDSGAGESPSSPASTASETPTPTPTPSAKYKPASAEGPAENVPLPVMPEEAKVQSKEGLEAFARYWYEAANYGYETGDVGPVQAISSPDCTTCLNYYEVVDNGFRENDWIANANIDVRDAYSDYVLTPEGRYQALAQFTQDAMEYYGPEGLQGNEEADVAPSVQLFEATWNGDKWVAMNIVTIKG
ncbi:MULTISPECIES: DUF6318 family protein [unclassified Arthrobacter]|uniref:DUF6318 family protein n=1 Tax=unclassified Arthrobacter TaxID=235627 RepID=UPI001D14E2EF|nr:DUF6318 family protein [Arthrobacter sp. zg-Y1110]MCC3291902.1 DUF6318 family protein [Arthrobacter sp. zg-Y1110]MCC3302286.1 DUF6318 family protein [Arthrobacter sp. zg-Y895]UWX85728.1 DUF6318 family protein [Arthrobacter sp. zg-Y1110]